ncbi:unnamed protein product, partial [Chrysoparadoxa australica]
LASDEVTLEAWVMTGSGGQVLFQAPDGGDAGFSLAIVGAEDSVMEARTGVSLAAESEGLGLVDGTWHHIAMTRKGTDVMFFVDGISHP